MFGFFFFVIEIWFTPITFFFTLNKKTMNNVDIAMTKVRELQQMFFSADASPNSLFKASQELIAVMEKASAEIRTNYADISKKLTDQMNTGRVQE